MAKKNRTKAIKNVAEKSVRSFFTILIVILTVLALLLAYKGFVKKERVPSVFGYSLFVIATPSMTGAIDAGDAVLIKQSDTYAVGDIVTYFPENEKISVTHRIVRTEGSRYYAKGDANSGEDPDPIKKEQIVGKVAKVIPKIGILTEWMKSSVGIVFVVAATVIIILLFVIDEKSGFETEVRFNVGED